MVLCSLVERVFLVLGHVANGCFGKASPTATSSSVGSKSRGKKLHTGFTSAEAVEIPNSAFHTGKVVLQFAAERVESSGARDD